MTTTVVHKIYDFNKAMVGATVDTARNVATAVGDGLTNAFHIARDTGATVVGQAQSATERTVDQASNGAKQVVGQARSAGERTMNQASKGVKEVTGQARAQGKRANEQLDRVAQRTADRAIDAVDPTPSSGTPYEQWSKAELYERAQELDIATAYYASSQILVMLGEKYGRAKLNQMLELWGEGKRTPEVLKQALGKDSTELDREFAAFTSKLLGRYKKQFMPITRTGPFEAAEEAATKDPKSAKAQTTYALALLRHGKAKQAEATLAAALKIDPKFPRARNNYAAFLFSQQRYKEAAQQLEIVVKDSLYSGRPLAFVNLGLCREQLFDPEGAEEAFVRALAMDRTNSIALLEMAQLRFDAGDYLNSRKYYANYRAVVRKQSARGLWLGIRLARESGNLNDESSYALALSNLYPDSVEYEAYKRTVSP